MKGFLCAAPESRRAEGEAALSVSVCVHARVYVIGTHSEFEMEESSQRWPKLPRTAVFV